MKHTKKYVEEPFDRVIRLSRGKKVYCSQEMREARTGGLEWTFHQVEFGW